MQWRCGVKLSQLSGAKSHAIVELQQLQNVHTTPIHLAERLRRWGFMSASARKISTDGNEVALNPIIDLVVHKGAVVRH